MITLAMVLTYYAGWSWYAYLFAFYADVILLAVWTRGVE